MGCIEEADCNLIMIATYDELVEENSMVRLIDRFALTMFHKNTTKS